MDVMWAALKVKERAEHAERRATRRREQADWDYMMAHIRSLVLCGRTAKVRKDAARELAMYEFIAKQRSEAASG